MIVKLVIYLGIILIILASANSMPSKSIKNSVNDVNLKNQIILIDNALISYYRFHAAFPDEINSSLLRQFGIEILDVSAFSYDKKAENEFILSTKLANNEFYFSPNSNIKIDL